METEIKSSEPVIAQPADNNSSSQDSLQDQALQSQNTKKPKRKIHIPKIAILIGFLIILLVLMEGGLFLAKKSNTSTLTPIPINQVSPTPNLQANLLTYEHTEHEFTIGYPLDLTPQKLNTLNKGSWELRFNDKDNWNYIYMHKSTNPVSGETRKPITSIEDSIQGVDNPEFFNLQGYPAVKFTEKGFDPETNKKSTFITQIVLKDNSLWYITINLKTGSEEEINLVNQIISSFQFTDSNSLIVLPEPSGTTASSPANPGKTEPDTPANSMGMCTLEAKICPDGVTSVGRSGQNCEFEKCPGE